MTDFVDLYVSPEALGVVALGAVLLFWVVGAYNRLVQLRNALTQAGGKVNEVLQRRGSAALPLVAALRAPMAAEHGALDALLMAHTEAERTRAAWAQTPLSPRAAEDWRMAEAGLAAATTRVLALVSMHPALGPGGNPPAPLTAALQAWQDGQDRLPFVQQWFNEASAAYNEAVGQFPTRLLARALGFEPAGRL